MYINLTLCRAELCPPDSCPWPTPCDQPQVCPETVHRLGALLPCTDGDLGAWLAAVVRLVPPPAARQHDERHAAAIPVDAAAVPPLVGLAVLAALQLESGAAARAPSTAAAAAGPTALQSLPLAGRLLLWLQRVLVSGGHCLLAEGRAWQDGECPACACPRGRALLMVPRPCTCTARPLGHCWWSARATRGGFYPHVAAGDKDVRGPIEATCMLLQSIVQYGSTVPLSCAVLSARCDGRPGCMHPAAAR